MIGKKKEKRGKKVPEGSQGFVKRQPRALPPGSVSRGQNRVQARASNSQKKTKARGAKEGKDATDGKRQAAGERETSNCSLAHWVQRILNAA